jgi:hypothetical protein
MTVVQAAVVVQVAVRAVVVQVVGLVAVPVVVVRVVGSKWLRNRKTETIA